MLKIPTHMFSSLGRSAVVALVALVAVGAIGCAEREGSCQGSDTVDIFCGFTAPEDLEALPDQKRMLVSEYGGLAGKRPGTIKLLQLDSGDTRVLYPNALAAAPETLWGDPSCTEELGAVFAPHGIHLNKGPGGEDRLLVVNHAERESVEMFELIGVESDSPTLEWRGCVVAPDDVWLNEAAGLPGGAFVASNMAPRGTSAEELLKRETTGENTGYALVWSPGSGWEKLAGSDGIVTNGVQTSPTGDVVYVNYTLGNETRAIERATGKVLWTVEVAYPDNSSWTPGGKLMVASIRGSLEKVIECIEAANAFCPIEFGVVSIDPASGEASVVAEGGGAPFGFATVAVQVADRVYMGSATGERIGIVSVAP